LEAAASFAATQTKRSPIMGDKGGKKNKDKSQKQKTSQQEQKAKKQQDKNPKRTP
jgi:hypothetical protein